MFHEYNLPRWFCSYLIRIKKTEKGEVFRQSLLEIILPKLSENVCCEITAQEKNEIGIFLEFTKWIFTETHMMEAALRCLFPLEVEDIKKINLLVQEHADLIIESLTYVECQENQYSKLSNACYWLEGESASLLRALRSDILIDPKKKQWFHKSEFIKYIMKYHYGPYYSVESIDKQKELINILKKDLKLKGFHPTKAINEFGCETKLAIRFLKDQIGKNKLNKKEDK